MNKNIVIAPNIVVLFISNMLILAPCVLIGMNASRLFYPTIYSSWVYPSMLFILGAFLFYLGVKGAALRLHHAVKNKEKFLFWNSSTELIFAAMAGFGFGTSVSALTVGIYILFQNTA